VLRLLLLVVVLVLPHRYLQAQQQPHHGWRR
jgi:hypothetical protein